MTSVFIFGIQYPNARQVDAEVEVDLRFSSPLFMLMQPKVKFAELLPSLADKIYAPRCPISQFYAKVRILYRVVSKRWVV